MAVKIVVLVVMIVLAAVDELGPELKLIIFSFVSKLREPRTKPESALKP